jgi:hypothetical protein
MAKLADIPDLRLAAVSHGEPITGAVAAKLRGDRTTELG